MYSRVLPEFQPPSPASRLNCKIIFYIFPIHFQSSIHFSHLYMIRPIVQYVLVFVHIRIIFDLLYITFLKMCVFFFIFSVQLLLEFLPAIARNARTYPTFLRIVNVFPSENETSCGTSDRPILTEKTNVSTLEFIQKKIIYCDFFHE